MYNNNPYHNNIHAADVVQSMVALLATSDFTTQLLPLEILAVIMACAVHDVGHPGTLSQCVLHGFSLLIVAVFLDWQPSLFSHHRSVIWQVRIVCSMR